MSRVKLSEYRAKQLQDASSSAVSIHLDTASSDIDKLDSSLAYVIKVDQGIKKRGKQGLLKLNIAKANALAAVRELSSKGFVRFIAEPMLEHGDDEEKYLSFERTRNGIVASFSHTGGIDIEDNPESVNQLDPQDLPLPKDFIDKILTIIDKEHITFLEINPLVVRDGSCILLDAAVLVDSAGEYQASWTSDDIVEARTLTEAESTVSVMDQNSPAAFSFRVLNPNGALWMLLSGGGASITIADEAANQGKSHIIGNYGEYSGGPTAEETYLYTLEVIKQALASEAEPLAIIVAGGVANFTDVKKTFKGIIQALGERLEDLQSKKVRVYVRRGGPNETEGLALIREFLDRNNLLGAVHGSDMVLTEVINEALEYLDA